MFSTEDERKAESFVQYMTVANPYTKWNTWPDIRKERKGLVPHGHGEFVTTYLNDVALRSLAKGDGMTEGFIIVIENYDERKTMVGLAAMYKVAGYNPGADIGIGSS
jgi:hypothetical protein